mgnify:CR=1 FL=1
MNKSAVNKKRLIAAILIMSLFQMGMVGLSPVTASISQAFPGISELTAQLAATFLNLVLVITAIFSGVISRRFGRRWMTVTGLMLFVAAGVCGTLFSVNIAAVYVWSALLGAGTGLFVPVASSLMMDDLDERERAGIAGWQTAAVNIGGVVFSLGAGLLASGAWSRTYLMYVLALPAALFCLRALPKKRGERAGNGERSSGGMPPAPVWMAALCTMLFAVLYFVFSTNVSLLAAEKGLSATTASGVLSACFMLGGVVFGLLFARALGLLGRALPAAAFLLLALSYGAVCVFGALPALMLAAMVGGGSLSLIFPYYVITIADRVDPAASVLSASLIVSIGPNFGSFISPMIITNLAGLFGASVTDRFLLAGTLAVLGCVILLARARRKEKSK